MSIAVSVKVHDGVVLASDSASTLFKEGGVGNVYENANKIFNLHKRLPVGAITWGTGAIGHASVATLVKDLRRVLTSTSPEDAKWMLDTDDYTVEQVAELTREFLFEDHYKKAFADLRGRKPPLGFIVAGYSAGADLAEEWEIKIENGECQAPRRMRKQEDTGIMWGGEPEVITRIVFGHGTGLRSVLKELGVPEAQVHPAIQQIASRLKVDLAPPPMPIQDAIDLAAFLVRTTIMFSRFKPGPPTVGGPVEVATITKHEGFKWVQRKHYYDQEFNPEHRE